MPLSTSNFRISVNRQLRILGSSLLIRAAVERQFEIIGEALGRAAATDPALTTKFLELPRVIALRNRLIHGYDSVDDQIIWDIVRTKLPELHRLLRRELAVAGFPGRLRTGYRGRTAWSEKR